MDSDAEYTLLTEAAPRISSGQEKEQAPPARYTLDTAQEVDPVSTSSSPRTTILKNGRADSVEYAVRAKGNRSRKRVTLVDDRGEFNPRQKNVFLSMVQQHS